MTDEENSPNDNISLTKVCRIAGTLVQLYSSIAGL